MMSSEELNNRDLLGWDSNQRRVYGQILFDLTPENADQVEEDIQTELLGLQQEGGKLPFFLMVFTFDQVSGKTNHFLIRYSSEALKLLIDTVRDPSNVWNEYLLHTKEEKSDLESALHNLMGTAKEQREAEDGLYQVAQIGLWHPNFAIDMKQEDQGVIYREFPVLEHFPTTGRGFTRRVGRFMKYYFDETQFQKMAAEDPQNKEVQFWLELKRRPNIGEELESRYQIPWFIMNPNYGEKDGKAPDSIYAIPCGAYSLKGQITAEEYEELLGKQFVQSNGMKTSELTHFLIPRGYRVRVNTIFKNKGKYLQSRPHYYPNKPFEGMKEVNLNCWEDHWFREDGYIECFLVRLERAKELEIIKPFNAFEFQEKYENLSFDAMLHFNDKKFVAEHPNEYEFTRNDYDIPEFQNRNTIERLYFADFEATTDEYHHRPFLICAKGVDAITEQGELQFADREEYTFWGENCGKQFLDALLRLYGEKNPRRKDPRCRVYFHNLKYDFTFLLPLLSDVHEITKEGRLYSAKACYKNKGQKCYIDFWDSLPIFQCSLDRAVRDYLTEEERAKMNIQKEVFPYDFYTYKMFEEYPDYCAYCEETKNSLKSEGDYEEFIKNCEKIGALSEKEGKKTFNYKEYAIFYCRQDVRCLAAIVVKFAQLLIGKGCQGVYGTPPFSLDLRSYRTASSLGYDYFQRSVMFKQNEKGEWEPRHEWAAPKNSLRAIIQKTVRGGRVMTRDNQKYHHVAESEDKIVQDYDAVSLYPSAMSLLWLTDGVPKLIKGNYGKNEFVSWFADPESDTSNKRYKDGCIHLTWLNTRRKLHFPLLCIKDEKTKLNEYKNFDEEEVDTWVNSIDLFNLIEFQAAEFKWDAAIVWEGQRHFEIRNTIQNLFDFRFLNHGKYADEPGGVVTKHEHPIQNIAKLMMNSIYGKSVLKVSNKEKVLVEATRWQKNKVTGGFEEYDNWLKFFKANLYKIKKITPISERLCEVEVYKRDVSSSMNIFGSNVLAMARRLIGRVMSLAEEMEDLYPWMSPGLFYTDTDSMHITNELLKVTENEYAARYHRELRGEKLGQFHPDFDAPKTYNVGERVKGAVDCWFIAKKMYADKLLGFEGSIGYHLRMKGIPSDLVRFEQYADIYENKTVVFDLLIGHCSFFFENGKVGSRRVMTRAIMTKEARKEQQSRKRKRSHSTPISQISEDEEAKQDEIFDFSGVEFPSFYLEKRPKPDPTRLEEVIEIEEDGDTVLLPLEPDSEQGSQVNEVEIIDIE